MNIPFTLTDLQRMATASSFDRGQDYYDEGAVRELTYDGESFSARVLGTYRYRITISGTQAEPHFHCSCPYDYGGICKHVVAVGLAILEGEAETGAALYEEATVVEDPAVLLSRFPSLFNQVTDSMKIQFLEQVLSQNAALRAQFAKYAETYAGSLVASDDTAYTETIENVKEEVALHLESLTFDEDELYAPDYYENGGYYDEWEDAYQSAQRIIREALEPYEKKIRRHWQQGELAKGMAVLLGIYEGKSVTTEPASDPLGILDDGYAEIVDEVVRELVAGLLPPLAEIIKSPAETQATIHLLLDRYQQHDVSVQELRNQKTYVFYQLKDFETLLIVLADNPDTAQFLLNRLQERDLVDTDTAYVLLHLTQQLDDDALWISTAEDFALYEAAIARQLLDKYQEEKRSEDFLRIAKQTFRQFPDQIDEYLAGHLPNDDQIDFYKEVHLHLIRRLHRLDYYLVIRTYLSEAEKATLIKDVAYDDEFYIRLLATEEHYSDILKRVQERIHVDYHFDRLIEPILSVYPDECFAMLRQKCRKAIEQRGRAVYQRISRWLQLMTRIEDHREETSTFIDQFYHHKPSLPALKDEMRRADLV